MENTGSKCVVTFTKRFPVQEHEESSRVQNYRVGETVEFSSEENAFRYLVYINAGEDDVTLTYLAAEAE